MHNRDKKHTGTKVILSADEVFAADVKRLADKCNAHKVGGKR